MRIILSRITLFQIFILSALVFIASLACYPVESDDLYMYLAIGRRFFNQGSFPAVDPFIYSINDYQWTILHHWLGILSYYTMYLIGGFDLIVIFKTILISATAFLPLLLIDKKKKESLFVWFTGVFLTMNAITFRMMERTSLFSDLFIIAVLVIVLAELKKPNKLKYFLPIIFVFWANLHPGYPVGWALCFFYLIVAFRQNFKTKDYRHFLYLTTFSIVAVLLNPRGLEGFLHPFNFASNEGVVYRQYFYEWMPTLAPIFRYRLFNLFMYTLIFMTASVLYLNRKRKPFAETILFLFFLFYGFYTIRFVPTMCFVFITLSVYLANNLREFNKTNKLLKYALLLVFVISLKNIFYGHESISGKKEFGLGVASNFMPSGAVSFININLDKIHNIFNTHILGNYLAWMWDGQRKVFYHGFITDANFYLQEYLAFYSNREWFDKQIAKYQIDCILLDRFSFNDIIAQTLLKHEEWYLAYSDSDSRVYLKKN